MTPRGTATASHWNHIAGDWPTGKHENPSHSRALTVIREHYRIP